MHGQSSASIKSYIAELEQIYKKLKLWQSYDIVMVYITEKHAMSSFHGFEKERY